MDSFDFEPSLLGVWNDDEEPEKATEESQDVHERRIHDHDDDMITGDNANRSDTSWDGRVIQWHAALGVTGFNVENATAASGNHNHHNYHGYSNNDAASTTGPTKVSAGTAAAISETTSIHDEDRSATTRSSGSSSRTPNSSDRASSSLHPLAIQSSARCPPPSHDAESLNGSVLTEPNNLMQPPSSSADLYSVDLSQALERSNLGLTALATPMPAQGVTPALAATNSHLTILANNFLLAATNPAPTQAPPVLPTGESYHVQNVARSTVNPPPSFQRMPGSIVGAAAAPRAPRVHHPSSSTPSNTASTSNTGTSSSLPPFYLFDAPIELRANFMQNQRKLGLPIEHDPNSFYYGETVNGFHPQQLLKTGALTQQQASNLLQVGVDPTTGGAAASLHHRHGHPPHPPQMIDARHGGNSSRRNRTGQIKNEREQKRAQKITELIDQLRVQIQNDGWQVEGRSKFNTLSKYVVVV
jgi:hypothetical protein